METDWKKFSAMLPVWRERYLVECNARLIRTLGRAGKTETERFWAAEEQIRKEARTLQRCLDGYSRSRMELHLWEMLAVRMITREDLADFSADLRNRLFPVYPENRE